MTRFTSDSPPVPHVVFVCEHGAAKSVLAATYFNHLAQQRGLSIRALARGTSPDLEIPHPVVAGLAREGFAPCTPAPTRLDVNDLANAWKVVTFDQPQVAALVPASSAVVAWNELPPVSDDFDSAREVIFSKVEALIEESGRCDK